MNRITIIGRLTAEPKLRETTRTDIPTLCKMTVAVTRRFENADGVKDTDFFTVIAWKSLAEICVKHLVKGQRIAVSGRVQNRSYEDENGVKKYASEIVADEVEFLDKPLEKAELEPKTTKTDSKKRTYADPVSIDDDDLPF